MLLYLFLLMTLFLKCIGDDEGEKDVFKGGEEVKEEMGQKRDEEEKGGDAEVEDEEADDDDEVSRSRRR